MTFCYVYLAITLNTSAGPHLSFCLRTFSLFVVGFSIRFQQEIDLYLATGAFVILFLLFSKTTTRISNLLTLEIHLIWDKLRGEFSKGYIVGFLFVYNGIAYYSVAV